MIWVRALAVVSEALAAEIKRLETTLDERVITYNFLHNILNQEKPILGNYRRKCEKLRLWELPVKWRLAIALILRVGHEP